MKATLKDIAAKTGFSITTVSRVLSGKGDINRISSSTKESIISTAKEYGYKSSLDKIKTVQNDTTLGLIVPSVSNPYFSDIASTVIKECRKYGYSTIVIDADESSEMESMAVSLLTSNRVKGIIASPCGEDPFVFESIRESIPVVLIDRYYPKSTLPYVTTNNYLGSYSAVNHLIRNHHTRIACIQGATNSAPNVKRVSGYLSALEDAGIKNNAIVVGNEFSIQNGYIETKLLLESPNPPTAIYALSNTIMLGAIKAISEAKMHIPDDISLLAFDNQLFMDYLTPSITRVSQPIEEMGKLATKLLIDSILTKKECLNQIELAPELIIRNSVGNNT